MLTVWRYLLTRYDWVIAPNSFEAVIEMPAGAKIVHVDTKDGRDINVWAMVNTSGVEEVKRKFLLLGTGVEIRDGLDFIGSVVLEGGGFVWHVFEQAQS